MGTTDRVNRMNCVDRLPNDVISEVLSFVPPLDLLSSVARVSRQFASIVSDKKIVDAFVRLRLHLSQKFERVSHAASAAKVLPVLCFASKKSTDISSVRFRHRILRTIP